MGRDWKPGDVAMVTWNERGGQRMMMRSSKGRWIEPTGTFSDERVKDVRPLVVIDPGDREQARALVDAFYAADVEVGDHHHYGRMQAALRSLIEPPRPPEPTGLGAVVEDDKGRRWIRLHSRDLQRPWGPEGNIGGESMATWCTYAKVNAVRVLSEGVQP